MEPDFKGFATKAGLKCSDGRTITAEAFKHMNGATVPLVWQHGHDSPDNILGHVVLTHVDDGVRCAGFFNDTPAGKTSKALVKHGDIKHLSIFANQLIEKSKQVLHGMICEVSLVLRGANPGALIDFVAIRHADTGEIEELQDEAIIHTGLEIELDEDDEELEHATGDMTLADVYDTFDDVQKNFFNWAIGVALEKGNMAQSATAEDAKEDESAEEAGDGETTTPEGENLTHQEGSTVTRKVFEKQGEGQQGETHTLSHADVQGIMANAAKRGSLKLAVEDYALAHGITDIDLLFPEAKNLFDKPEFDKRRTEWVAGVLNGTRKSPFSRVKTMVADLTQDQARARGYIKATLKKEEWFGLSKRTTGPTTVYKKQKLDRDDIIDIRDFDVVAWMKGEMRLMLEEEIATAILIGDGRDAGDDDKIKDPVGATDGNGIRSILNDDDFFTAKFNVNLADANSDYMELVEAIIRNRKFYKGTGRPTMYTTLGVISELLLLKDGNERRYWKNVEELANELMVDGIVAVETMERVPAVLCILVNLTDYNVGTDQGGEISLFDDFDLDYNQYKYLIETRLSGALVRPRSAQVYTTEGLDSGDTLVVPVSPSFVDNVITPATTTGVTYKRADTDATVTTGAPITLTAGQSLTIYAVPSGSTYYFANNIEDEWTFTYEA